MLLKAQCEEKLVRALIKAVVFTFQKGLTYSLEFACKPEKDPSWLIHTQFFRLLNILHTGYSSLLCGTS